MPNAYVRLIDRVRDVGRLGAVGQLLEWDQETYMPKEGIEPRAGQIALVAASAHEKLVSDETRRLLDEAAVDPGDYVAETNLRETRRSFDRAVRVPTELVREIAHTSSLAREAWMSARKNAAFDEFAPFLEKLVTLQRRVADHVGFETEPYDALLDEYEPGARATDIATLFEELRGATVTLLERITAAPRKPDVSILAREFPIDLQMLLCRKMATALHFDFDRGRCDVAVHPFSLSIGGSQDVRITTRYEQRHLTGGLFATFHETGHALYEQGLLEEHAFTPMGEFVSLGIHESQSRLWENQVGRSRAFWSYHWDELRQMFPDALRGVTMEAFYSAINAVAPSLIRVEADELTYNLHIILRFEIERALISGTMTTQEISEAWNEKMAKSVGIAPPSDRDGCLQDIHWSLGALGYFPTYTLGNLYAAQFFEQAGKDIPDLNDRIASNDLRTLLDWLRTNIHQHGRRYGAGELVEKVTGKPLSIEPFVDQVTRKFSEVYGL